MRATGSAGVARDMLTSLSFPFWRLKFTGHRLQLPSNKFLNRNLMRDGAMSFDIPILTSTNDFLGGSP
jgi:hypothetical protein